MEDCCETLPSAQDSCCSEKLSELWLPSEDLPQVRTEHTAAQVEEAPKAPSITESYQRLIRKRGESVSPGGCPGSDGCSHTHVHEAALTGLSGKRT